MPAVPPRWLFLVALFLGVFVVAAWFFSGIFVAALADSPTGTSQPGAVDWARVLAAAAVVAMLVTGVVGSLIRLARS